MKIKMGFVIMLLIFSLFMGITVISIGLGAAFPSINMIARPLVCSNGELAVESQTYNVYPGKTVLTRNWYCVDGQTGEKNKLNVFQIGFFAGIMYGLMLFAVLFVLILIRRGKSASGSGQKV